jgi:hypothetical protein
MSHLAGLDSYLDLQAFVYPPCVSSFNAVWAIRISSAQRQVHHQSLCRRNREPARLQTSQFILFFYVG